MTVVKIPSPSNMNETMLRQLVWIALVVCLNITTGYIVHPDFDQCDRPQCHPIDEILMNNVRSNVEPCQDFSAYACGKNDSRRASYVSFIQNEPLSDGSKIQDLEEILSGVVSLSMEESSVDALKIEREIYQKCRDVGTYTEEAKESYRRLLAKYNSQYDRNMHWSHVDIKFAQEGFGFAFFDLEIVERENPENREPQRFIQISPPSDNVMDMNDLLMSNYMEKLQHNPNSDSYYNRRNEPSSGTQQDLKRFINEFNKILPYEKLEDSYLQENALPEPQLLGDWQRKYNNENGHPHSKITWTHLLNALFSKINTHIDEYTQVIVIDKPYFSRLSELLRLTTNANTIIDYIHLRYVSKTIGSVIEEYKEKYSIVPPIKGLLCTPGLLVGAAHIYAHQYFPEENKELVEVIFTTVKKIILKHLESENYNLQATTDVTNNFLRQLRHSDVMIGYPDWLYDKTFIKNFYGHRMVISNNYHVNQLRLMEVLLRHKLKTYTNVNLSLINIKQFFKTFTEEKISFSKNLKQIIFPLRAFSENNFKFLSAQLYEPINYGAAGTALASELYLYWLRKVAYDQNATRCVQEDLPVNRNKQGPNEFLLKATAYLLGLRTAYEAWPNKDSYPIQFPKFGALTDYRLFFLSFAESLCIAKEQKGEFPQYKFINFAVKNTLGFSDAFQCDRHHEMNKSHKCDPLKY